MRASSYMRRASKVLPRFLWRVPRSVRVDASAATVSGLPGSASRARVWACGVGPKDRRAAMRLGSGPSPRGCENARPGGARRTRAPRCCCCARAVRRPTSGSTGRKRSRRGGVRERLGLRRRASTASLSMLSFWKRCPIAVSAPACAGWCERTAMKHWYASLWKPIACTRSTRHIGATVAAQLSLYPHMDPLGPRGLARAALRQSHFAKVVAQRRASRQLPFSMSRSSSSGLPARSWSYSGSACTSGTGESGRGPSHVPQLDGSWHESWRSSCTMGMHEP